MATTRRVKAPAVSIYETKAEAELALVKIAELQRNRIEIMTVAERQISTIKEDARKATLPIENEIGELVKNLTYYAQYNRAVLTDDNKTKTVKFVHGTLQWRMTPAAVAIKGVEDVKKRLKQLGLTRFIRIKEEIDKEAMGRERPVAEAVAGVSFSQREEFVITPGDTKIEIAKPIKATTKPKELASH
ncbi:MAG TPA: host-nuclease inhibitor Gam family protein [Candidatus Microsaccharimonas sp.]|jgi:phage host-nuclease inhibitor protein Gam